MARNWKRNNGTEVVIKKTRDERAIYWREETIERKDGEVKGELTDKNADKKSYFKIRLFLLKLFTHKL